MTLQPELSDIDLDIIRKRGLDKERYRISKEICALITANKLGSKFSYLLDKAQIDSAKLKKDQGGQFVLNPALLPVLNAEELKRLKEAILSELNGS